jgi:lipocalin
MYGINKINDENMQIGNYAYSNYTGQWYIVSSLPNIVQEGLSIYALIRLDGQGYFYKSESLNDLRNKISNDGETIIYNGLIAEE